MFLVVFSLSWVNFSGELPQPWKIDEIVKIYESRFFFLVLRGQLDDPEWQRDTLARTNPPVGKYLFGLSIWLHGLTVERDLELEHYLLHYTLQLPSSLNTKYLPMRLAVRRVSIISTSLSIAMIATWLAAEFGSVVGLFIGAIWARHLFVMQTACWGVFDPILVLFATILFLLLVGRHDMNGSASKSGALAITAGVVAAAAFQTRLNGLVIVLSVITVLLGQAIRSRKLGPAVDCCIALISCLIGSVAMNPLYWQRGRWFAHSYEQLAMRVSLRFVDQLRELKQIAADPFFDAWRLPTIPERVNFAAQTWFTGKSGVILLAGFALLLLYLIARRSEVSPRTVLVLLFSLPVIIAMAGWIPFTSPRYLLIAFPHLMLLAGCGFGESVRLLRGHWDRRLGSPPYSSAPDHS